LSQVSINKYRKHVRNLGMIDISSKKKFQTGDLVLLYDSKFLQHPGKFQMHWLGPYVIRYVTEAGVVQLEKLDGEVMEGLVNGSQLKLYRDGHPSMH
jgi:hypothetical protein